MATPPWKSNVGGPSDDDLNRVVKAHQEQKRQSEAQRREEVKREVKRLVADAEVYEHRLAERGSREYERLYKIRGKWMRFTNINRAYTASAAVNEGSIKALRTTLPKRHKDALGSLPRNPSVAWLRAIDRNAGIDQGRKETSEMNKREAIETIERIKLAAQLPAKSKRVHMPDPNGE